MSWPITVAQLREELKGVSPSIASDDRLAGIVASAMTKVEEIVGPRRGQVLRDVKRVWRTTDTLVLRHAAGQVTRVTCGGVDVDGWTFDALPESDRSVYVEGGVGPGRVVIDYRAPWDIWPDVEAAALALAAHEALQRIPGLGGSGDAGSPMGYGIPNRVSDVLDLHRETGGLS